MKKYHSRFCNINRNFSQFNALDCGLVQFNSFEGPLLPSPLASGTQNSQCPTETIGWNCRRREAHNGVGHCPICSE